MSSRAYFVTFKTPTRTDVLEGFTSIDDAEAIQSIGRIIAQYPKAVWNPKELKFPQSKQERDELFKAFQVANAEQPSTKDLGLDHGIRVLTNPELVPGTAEWHAANGTAPDPVAAKVE